MEINPRNFKVNDKLIRERLKLSRDAVIVPFGYEDAIDEAIISMLKKRYDTGSLFIRTRPDFFIIDNKILYFVEAKKTVKSIEAIQLLYNKRCEQMGIKVIYSFPDFAINATQIPMETVIVPENYKEKFDVNLKYLFEEEGVEDFRYIGQIDEGSGDAFVPIDEEDLKILAEGMS